MAKAVGVADKVITPEQLCKSGSEDGHQKALFCWCASNVSTYPDLVWLFHIPNGGSRHIVEALKLKLMGVRKGVLDLMLPIKRGSFSGLWVELKRPKPKGVVSAEQKEWIAHLLSQGFGCYIAYGWEDARDCIIAYLEHK